MDWTEYIKFFTGLLAIVNPIGAVPMFLSLTTNQSTGERNRTSVLAAATVLMVLGVSLLMGEAILHFFGITIASFRVAGGILILLIAISMMHAKLSAAKQTEEEAQDAAEKDSIAVVPLGVPLLAGPGAISTIILFAHRDSSLLHYVIGGMEILSLALSIWLSFRLAPAIGKLLGKTGINIITRIMGLIIAALGVEFMTNGLKQLLPGLAG
ncbi:MAG: YchE family NAAT transporter [Gammaproteobacteria bacterium]|jgi:multiple antibiotic resistance protein